MTKREAASKGTFRYRRILALKPKGLVLPVIHSSIVKAFRSLDVEVLEMPVPGDAEAFVSFNSLLASAGGRFDAGFLLDMGLDSVFIQKFKEIQIISKIHWIIWFVDDPDGYGFPDSCEPEWTRAFCWDREIARRYSSEGNWRGSPVCYLPLAADPEIFSLPDLRGGPRPEGGIFVGSTRHENSFLERAAASYPGLQETADRIWEAYAKDLTRPLHDLLEEFLSSLSLQVIREDPLARIWVQTFAYELGRRKRVEVVSRVLDGGRVFGDEGWGKFLPDLYRGKIEYGKELRAEYSRSSFLLDIRQPQARTGLTQRIFDGGACGIPVLTERTPEVENLFEPEKEIFTYRTIEEGIEKRDELLVSMPEAVRRAEKLRERILSEHTYAHRARQILDVFQRSI